MAVDPPEDDLMRCKSHNPRSGIFTRLVVYLPFLRPAFETFSLTLEDWLVIGLASLTVSPVIELGKWAVRKGWLGEAGR